MTAPSYPAVPPGKELVGPLPRVYFRGAGAYGGGERPWQVFDVPRDTCDPRYLSCTQHHTGCVCREAELSEERRELRWIVDEATASIRTVLAGHRLKHFPTWEEWPAYEGPLRELYARGGGPLACRCTGCQLVRGAEFLIPTDRNGVVLAPGEENRW